MSSQPMQASVMLTPYFRPALPSAGTFCAPAKGVSEMSSARVEEKLTLADMALDHDSHDRLLAVFYLLGEVCSNFRLVPVVFQGIAVAAVDH